MSQAAYRFSLGPLPLGFIRSANAVERHVSQWPQQVISGDAQTDHLKTYDSGARLVARTYVATTKSIFLNLIISYGITHDIRQAFLMTALSTLGAVPKMVVGSWNEKMWNKLQWGIEKNIEGKKETALRIFMRGLTRKILSNGIDAASFVATTGHLDQMAVFSGVRLAWTFGIDFMTDNVWNYVKWGTIKTNMHPKDPRLVPYLRRPRPFLNGLCYAAAAAAVAGVVTSRPPIPLNVRMTEENAAHDFPHPTDASNPAPNPTLG
jgi:hypothetical protein